MLKFDREKMFFYYNFPDINILNLNTSIFAIILIESDNIHIIKSEGQCCI